MVLLYSKGKINITNFVLWLQGMKLSEEITKTTFMSLLSIYRCASSISFFKMFVEWFPYIFFFGIWKSYLCMHIGILPLFYSTSILNTSSTGSSIVNSLYVFTKKEKEKLWCVSIHLLKALLYWEYQWRYFYLNVY